MNTKPRNRLVIVNRADPVICGHSVEGRNLAEAALERGFDEVRIVTWPIDRLEATGLPLKPLDRMLPYSEGIIVERPEPVGDYKVPDGRYLAGITGRLVELFTDGVPTVCLSLYLSPHTVAVTDAVRAAWSTGLPVNVTTIAEAVGSDVTNVVRSCVEQGRFGAAAHILSSYLAQDHCVAVSEYTRELIVASAAEIDAFHGTRFAEQCRERIRISYPAIDTSQYLDLDPAPRRRACSPPGASSATATCCSSRGSRRRRASTTSSPDSSAHPPTSDSSSSSRAADPTPSRCASSRRHRRSPTASCSSTTSTTPRSPT